MLLEMTDVILIALFIEAIVNALKPIWTKGETRLTVSEYVSMGMGVLLAVTCKINMLAYVVDIAYPLWVEYVFYALTGIAIGRGTNFLYDLWNKLKEWQGGQVLPGVEVEDVMELDHEEPDMEITHWPLEMIVGFARANGLALPDNMPTDEQAAKRYLIDYMFHDEETGADKVEEVEQKQPPEAGDAE